MGLTALEASFANSIIMPHMIDVNFSDIGGLESIKEEIEQMIGIPFSFFLLFHSIIKVYLCDSCVMFEMMK